MPAEITWRLERTPMLSDMAKLPPRAASTLAIFLTAAAPLHAHHGTSTFDGDTVVTLEGTIVENRWTNPHSYIVVETRGAEGGRRVVVEADGPSLIGPLGATRDSLSVGDRVVVFASPSRVADSNEYLAREMIKEDGTVVPLSVRYARAMESD